MAIGKEQSGAVLTFTNAGGTAVTAGTLHAVGDIVGVVASTAAADGGTGELAVDGVFEVTKVTTDVVTAGQPLYFATDKLTNVNAGATPFAGYATEAASGSVTKVKVLLARAKGFQGGAATMAATGAQAISPSVLSSGIAYVSVPNTAALTLTLPAKAAVPQGALLTITKTSNDAEAVTIAANAADTLRGATGTIDAATDCVTIHYDKTYGPTVISNRIT